MLLPSQAWAAGQWVDATTTFTDGTAGAQSIAIDDFALFTTTASDGFIVAATIPFNVISIDVTTATSGAASPTTDVAYWGRPTSGLASTATGWVTASALIKPADAAHWATGERLIVANAPASLMVSVASGDITGGGPLIGKYAIRVRATTAPTTAGNAARLYVGKEVFRVVSAGANSENTIGGGIGAETRTFVGGLSLQSYYATAANSNHLYLEYE